MTDHEVAQEGETGWGDGRTAFCLYRDHHVLPFQREQAEPALAEDTDKNTNKLTCTYKEQ